ncbi:MAG: serine protease [Minisyncoccia bacterium]
MSLKSIILFILASVFGFGSINTQLYVAPEIRETKVTETATTTEKKLTEKAVATSTASSTPESKKEVVKKKPVPPPQPALATKKVEEKSVQPSPQIQAPVIILPPPDFETINNKAREVVVNILCTPKGRDLSPITGTGIVVGQAGVILTNAHIGQYLLLKDFREKDNIECVARTGSPAYPRHRLELIYISPTWVENNKTLLKQENPKGTGENDFAFLRITENIDKSPLPEGFKYISMNIAEDIGKDEPVLLISYPAGFLGGISILQDLNITSSITRIAEIFTFKLNTIDLISVPGTVLSQKGSSGGAVIDRHTSLIGIITTSSDGDTTDKRDLRAITLAYINRTLAEELGINLEQFIQADPKEFARKFQEINAPNLTKLIVDELNR